MKSPTMVAIRHVAERASVSKMSVSRVLNNSPLVNEATRTRVLQAMTELNYTPNAPARSLKRLVKRRSAKSTGASKASLTPSGPLIAT